MSTATGTGISTGIAPLRMALLAGNRRESPAPLPAPAGQQPDPDLRRFLIDLCAPYGLTPREELLDEVRESYVEMGEAVLDGLDGPPPDLIVIAQAVPEADPRRATANHLALRYPGRPLAFAIGDQGSAAPFSALAAMAQYLRCGPWRRGLLLILEQAVGHGHVPSLVLPCADTAVALLLGDTDRTATAEVVAEVVAVRQHAGVAAAELPALLATELTHLGAGSPSVQVVASASVLAWLPSRWAAAATVAAPGRFCTAVWWELVTALPGWSAYGQRMILVDYDAVLSYACLAAVDLRS